MYHKSANAADSSSGNLTFIFQSMGTEEKRGTTFRSSTDEIFLRHLLGITKLDKEKNQCIRGK